jgi:hypothetical protein
MEERRKEGIYVGRPMSTNGVYLVTSPADCPKTRPENIIGLVSLFHKSVKIMLEAVEIDENVRDWFETTAEKNRPLEINRQQCLKISTGNL